MASIQYGTPDSSGDYPNSLGSPRPNPANRFFGYAPDAARIGPRRTTLGDGATYQFGFRTDYYAHLEIHHLAPSQMGDALDLKLALLNGETVRVVTDDADSSAYTCTLKPGTEPTITNDDDQRLLFSFACDLRSADPILVNYGAAAT